MDMLLLTITFISIAAAVAAVINAQRLRRQDRARSDARAAALAAAADAPAGSDGDWQQVEGEWRWVTRREPSLAGAAPLTAESTAALFGTVQREEPAGSRLPIFAAAGLIAVLGGALVFLNTPASTPDGATVGHVVQTDPIELVALGHARETSVLTISGTVRNPASGVKVEGLTAVISLLDRTGALVSTKDVPLDYRALRPGEEAPFKVSIPDPGAIARYRVSFRAGTDVVPHVDRRIDTKLASALQ